MLVSGIELSGSSLTYNNFDLSLYFYFQLNEVFIAGGQ